GDDQKNHERQQFIRLGNGERVDRRGGEEILKKERKNQSVDRRPENEPYGRYEKNPEEKHRGGGEWGEFWWHTNHPRGVHDGERCIYKMQGYKRESLRPA